jgi:hypothetical protein
METLKPKSPEEKRSKGEGGNLKQWSKLEDVLEHIGKRVVVLNAESGEEVLSGKICADTDLLGTGGILDTDSSGNFRAGIPFPKDPRKFQEEMSKFLFRLVE